MNPFEYARPAQIGDAVHTLAQHPGARPVAGGTNIIDLMKINVEQPPLLLDINDLPLSEVRQTPNGVRIGALARMSDVADHPLIRSQYPVIAEALLASASPQLRNMASIGGNVMQRTRCPYFRNTAMPCNKRHPGSGCGAIAGNNERHAILGVSNHCIATHPSDLAVALVALDATLHLHGPHGERPVLLDAFYRLPGNTPHLEHDLRPGEIITAIEVPASPMARHSHYLKVRDRASFEFALASAAVGLDMANGTIRQARVALGGVGTKPWRSHEAEAELAGKAATDAVFKAAAQAALHGAVLHQHNAYKAALAQRTLVHAFTTAAAKESST